ncbi:transporter [Campylobacter sp. RM12916]|nr:transporter [Campylobacter sp. RM12916]
MCLYVDFFVFKLESIGEISLSEITQEMILLIICVIYAMCIKNKAKFHRLSVLIFGFFTTMLIRELDAFFDEIRHGSWIYPTLLVAISSIAYAFKDPKHLNDELERYLKTRSFIVALCGLTVVLVFSRVFGTMSFWMHVLNDKNTVQEGLELFGYILCLMSAVLYGRYVLKFNKEQYARFK